MFRRFYPLFGGFFMLSGFAPAAKAQLTYYTSLGSFSTAVSTNLVEDFEAVTPKDSFFSSFTHNGITYSGTPNVGVASAGYTNFGVPITTSSVLTANGDEDMTAAFGTPKTAVGFDTYTNTYGPAIIKIFGASGLLGTYSLTQDSTKVGFFGVVASQPITSFRWTTTNGASINTGFDNIRTGGILAVPEPSPLALLTGSLFFGANLFLRRRR